MALDPDVLVALLLRWSHVASGIFWIGLLYYFNVVQVPVFKRFEPAVRGILVQRLVPVALAWFRYAALATLLTGLLLFYQIGMHRDRYMATPKGHIIGAGMTLGLVMFLNVWLIIWPNQKRFIAAHREKAATGREVPAAAAQWSKRAFYASRVNFLLSFPMLFFMVASSHAPPALAEVLAVGFAIFVLAAAALWAATTSQPTTPTKT